MAGNTSANYLKDMDVEKIRKKPPENLQINHIYNHSEDQQWIKRMAVKEYKGELRKALK